MSLQTTKDRNEEIVAPYETKEIIEPIKIDKPVLK